MPDASPFYAHGRFEFLTRSSRAGGATLGVVARADVRRAQAPPVRRAGRPGARPRPAARLTLSLDRLSADARHLARIVSNRRLDKGCDNEDGWEACIDHEYDPHIDLIRDERPAHLQLTGSAS